MKKKTITNKLKQDINNFLNEFKPKTSKNIPKVKKNKIFDFLYWLICWQECYLNTVFQNTMHYEKKQKEFSNGKRIKPLRNTAWIDKLSNYLLFSLNKVKQSYYSMLNKKITNTKSFNDLKWLSLKERVYNQVLRLHDTSDIQKPHAKKMEKVSPTRDWSESKPWKNIQWQWYYAEWTVIYFQNKMLPFILNIFSSKDKKYIKWDNKVADSKEVSKENMKEWKNYNFLKFTIDIFDRWYDVFEFMKDLIDSWIKFIIRWKKTVSVIDIEYFHKIVWTLDTQMERENIWSRTEDMAKELDYVSNEDYDWFDVWYKNVYKKWPNFKKDKNDIIAVTLVSARLNKKVEWIPEDLDTNEDEKEVEDNKGNKNKKKSKNKKEYSEREIYFFTNLDIETPDDALVIFKLYLKRRSIETWFRYLKQVFWLEKICLLKFEKIKNFCNLLVMASAYFYDRFYSIQNEQEYIKSMIKDDKIEEVVESKTIKFSNFILLYYLQFCIQKGIKKITVDSYTKFINHEMGDTIMYSYHFSVCEYLNSW